VHFVQLVGYGQGDLPSLDKLVASKKEFMVTGSFSGKDNWNQVGPVLFMPENGFDGYARCFKEAHAFVKP
jgi:hypothetical protein